MLEIILSFFVAIRVFFRSRSDTALEVLALLFVVKTSSTCRINKFGATRNMVTEDLPQSRVTSRNVLAKKRVSH